MEDMSAKIQEILSDKESMKQLNELAQMFSSAENNTSEETDNSACQSENSSGGMPDFDFSILFKLQDIMNKTSDDKAAGFLLALKPLLKEERQQKVENAVKMLKLFAVWEILKDSGILKDFLR